MSNVNIPIYDVIIDDEQLGMTAVSFVKEPAISIDFLAMEKQKAENMIWFSKHYKHEIVSPILIPNQLILRQAKDGSLYYIRWTEEAIANAAAKYLANGFWHNITIEHPMFYDENLTYDDVLEDDVYMQRMWIVDNPKTDDAKTKYGFDVPSGTLMVKYKVFNKALWSKIVDGTVRGLSIEAFTNVVKSNNNININLNMNKLDVNVKQMSLLQKFVQFLNDVSQDAKDIADEAKKDETGSGEVSLKYFLDDEHFVEVDAEGFVRDEEYNLVAEGEYKLADGNVLVVDANNKFVETKAAGEESVEEPVEAPIAEEKLKDEEKKDDEKTEDVVDEPKGEDDGVSDEPSVEDAPKVDGETEEGGNEENVEEQPSGENEGNVEVPLNLVPFEINGVEYMLPQEVIDYIKSLMGDGEALKAELMQMKEQMPSATPIPTVISQSEKSNDDVPSNLFTAIKLLNRH